ncbi:M48 family metallopeptidase [candidate division FCPU426 bacterium]|nr:M48 family metallopeptidase [candidate division FCPU426 bacterium]
MDNIILAGIFCAYVLVSAWGHFLDYLNVRQLRLVGDQVPPEFSGEITPEALRRMRDYTVDKSRLATWSGLAGQVVFGFFIFGGWLDLYARWLSSWNLSFILTGTVFFLILVFVQTLFTLPFSWHAHFRIETRYGFNTMTPGLWVLDQVKTALISLVLLAVTAAAGFSLVWFFPNSWWLWVWAFFLVFSLFIQYISPVVLAPLFNRFTPMENEALAGRIRELMEKAGLRISRVFKMDASRRSRHANAYFTGLGRVKRIVLYDSLLEKMDASEILAVLAHEVGHWKKKHVLKRLLAQEIVSLAALFAAYHLLQLDFLNGVFGIAAGSFPAQLVVLGVVVSLAAFPLEPLWNRWSRAQEREADAFAGRLTREPEALARALVKLSRENLANLHPHPWYAAFHYTHPPVVQRIRRLRQS